jgi:hypothetical protein
MKIHIALFTYFIVSFITITAMNTKKPEIVVVNDNQIILKEASLAHSLPPNLVGDTKSKPSADFKLTAGENGILTVLWKDETDGLKYKLNQCTLTLHNLSIILSCFRHIAPGLTEIMILTYDGNKDNINNDRGRLCSLSKLINKSRLEKRHDFLKIGWVSEKSKLLALSKLSLFVEDGKAFELIENVLNEKHIGVKIDKKVYSLLNSLRVKYVEYEIKDNPFCPDEKLGTRKKYNFIK